METPVHNSYSKSKALAAILAIVSFCVLSFSLISHVKFNVMATTVFDFAVHHYFLMIFISLTVLAASIKFYTSLDQNIDRSYRESHSFELSKDKRKRQKFFGLFKSTRDQDSTQESKFVKLEEVKKLVFSDVDVLQNEAEKLERQRYLQKATVLGNSYKQKVIVLFKDYTSKKHLIITVGEHTDEHLILKPGVTLPVKSIYKIEF